MADKILTLTNKDGTDNIYPVAGAMVADSVTTAMLQNGAVTSSKIDWTTLDYQTASLGSSQATVTTTAEYEYKAVSGLSLTLSGPVGAKYFVICTTTVKSPSGGYGDVYARIHVDGTMQTSISGNVIAADRLLPMTVSTVVSLTSTPQTVQFYIGGSAVGQYGIGAYSRITAIRIG